MRQKICSFVSTWTKQGYPDGIPDEAPANLEAMNLVGTYKMICKAILKNDVALTSLGFSKEKTASYMALKAIEIAARKI